ncbi:hypothetical protein B0H14DRAFT_2407811, partial [Mycena olivaceomarginata]
FCTSWKSVELSEKLVALIMEHKNIKQALFPLCDPNASMARGGGQSKAHMHFQLCQLHLGDDKKYKATLELAATIPQHRTAWSLKIKNHLTFLTRMALITRGYITEMGETGTGIENTSQIDMSVSNSFTNKRGTYLPLNAPATSVDVESQSRGDLCALPVVL